MPIQSEHDLKPEQRAILELVRKRHAAAERFHKVLRDKWSEWYGLFRNYRDFVRAYSETAERDRDGIMHDAKKEWGAELFIPYAYLTVETILPRALSNDPRMLLLPGTPEADYAVEPVKRLIERQQSDMSYGLRLQPTARRGFIYGLGVQKLDWRTKTRKVRRVKPRLLGNGYKVEDGEEAIYDGPWAEDVDNFDFFWDPAAKDMETANWIIHRTWRTHDYVMNRLNSGEWGEVDLEEELVKGLGSESARGEAWSERYLAAGLTEYDAKSERLHEIWEYHDGHNVYTILDKAFPVQIGKSPHYHGEIPFQIFRPTIVPGEFAGIGEIQPIAHLQHELNTLRGQRRDNATLVLQKGFIYSEGRVDPNDLVVGPGVGVPVLGDPRDVIQELNWNDIPGSGYQEEDAIKADIERTTGVSDPVSGAEGASQQTATGIQLIQSAANFRIQQKTKNLEQETIKPAARQMLWLNRQHVTEPIVVRVPDDQATEGFEFIEVGPDELGQDLDPIPEGGATNPDNELQKKQDALQMFQTFAGAPNVDLNKLTVHTLREFGIKDPEAWTMPPPPAPEEVAQVIGETLVQAGLDPAVVEQVLGQALATLGGAPPAEPPPPEQPMVDDPEQAPLP